MFEQIRKPHLFKEDWRRNESLNANLNRGDEMKDDANEDGSNVAEEEIRWEEMPLRDRILGFLEGKNDFYEMMDKYLEDAVREGRWNELLELGKELLLRSGLEDVKKIPVQIPAGAVVIAEAINLGAKCINDRFYSLKPALLVAAWKTGAKFGYGEDGAWYLFDPYVGTASFHNPGGEMDWYMDILQERTPKWIYGWSGVTRQNDAFQMLADFRSGEGIIPPMREDTTPDFLSRKKSEKELLKRGCREREFVLYSAHFVRDKEKLKNMFPPVHENQYGDHCTIEFQPESGRVGVYVGDKQTLEIYGRVITNMVDVLLVHDVKSKNRDPHITLSTARGISPAQSNEVIASIMEEETILEESELSEEIALAIKNGTLLKESKENERIVLAMERGIFFKVSGTVDVVEGYDSGRGNMII